MWQEIIQELFRAEVPALAGLGGQKGWLAVPSVTLSVPGKCLFLYYYSTNELSKNSNLLLTFPLSNHDTGRGKK